jgi:hypothetical protein
MITRLLDYDPLTGITQYHHFDPVTEVTTIETIQDVEPILNANKAMQNDTAYSKRGIKNEMWHAACVPNIIQEKWLREKGVDVWNNDHWPKVKRLLNDPDWKWLKTTTGTI